MWERPPTGTWKPNWGDIYLADDGQGFYASEDKVLGDLVGKRSHADKEDVGVAELFLRPRRGWFSYPRVVAHFSTTWIRTAKTPGCLELG